MARLLTILICCLSLTAYAQSAHQAEAAVFDSTDEYSTAFARAFFENDDFDNTIKVYDKADTATLSLRDLTNYAMATYFKRQYRKSLDLARYGLTRKGDHTPFNRLAFFCCTELKRYHDAQRYASTLFSQTDTTQLFYYDYAYYVKLFGNKYTLSDAERDHLILSYHYLIRHYTRQNDAATARRYAKKLQALAPDDDTARQALK